MNQRRYLEPSHKWRRSNKFNGKIENRLKPKKISRDDVLQQLNSLSTYMSGIYSNSNKRKRLPTDLNWVKKRFFLSYHSGKT